MRFPTVSYRLFSILCWLGVSSGALGQTVEWSDPAGYAEFDARHGPGYPGMNDVAATPWGVYAVGRSDCVDDPVYNDVNCKGLLIKYDADGKRLWRMVIRQRDSTWITAVAADETGVYIHGTFRRRDVEPPEPPDESFLRKYAHDGTLLWSFRDSEGNPKGYRITSIRAQALVLYDGNLYASSRRNLGSILRKFTLDGKLVWLRETAAGALAAGDGAVFASAGPRIRGKGGPYIYARDTEGNPLYRDETGSTVLKANIVAENGLAWHDGALYYCSVSPGLDNQYRDVYSLNRMQPDGTLVWSRTFGRTVFPQAEGCSVQADDDGVIFAGNLQLVHQDTYPANLTVRRFSFDGEELLRWDFPSLAAVPNSVSVVGDEVYVAGASLEDGRGFTARLSGAPLLKPALARLDGTTRGSAMRLALLDHHYGAGPVAARVQAPGSDTGETVYFDEDLRPGDYFAAADLNGNGHDELVVLSKRPAAVEIADGSSGTRLLHLALDADFEPIAAVIAFDGGTPVLAVLNQHYAKDYVRVDRFDARSGASLGTIAFNPSFTPLDLYAFSDGGVVQYAVLAADTTANAQHKLEIRTADGSLQRNLWLGTGMTPLRGLLYEDGGAPRIAVLRRNGEQGWMDVEVVDPAAGVLARLPFNAAYLPDDFEISPDVDANLAPQFTVVGRNEAGKVKAETRDLATGALLHNVYLVPSEPIEDLLYLAPETGVNTPSLALLVRDDYYSIPESRYRVVLVDLLTGSKTDNWYFELGTIP